jgi:hypothetical protein
MFHKTFKVNASYKIAEIFFSISKDNSTAHTESVDQSYPSLIFGLIDAVRPKPKERKRVGGPEGSGGPGGGRS